MKDGTDVPLVFYPKPDMKVVVYLHQWYFRVTDCDWTNVTYCTITVENPDKKIEHYHAGTVCNPHDVSNFRSGSFIAFRKALRLRWDDKHWRNPEKVWKMYHKKWSHFLAAMIDGKVGEWNDQHYNTDVF